MSARYTPPQGMAAADGWGLERLTTPSRLYGANGLSTGPDGRLYVAQVGGSQVSAINVDDGSIATISPMGGAIVAPDDLVFDEAGNLYLTEITEGRVSMLTPGGEARVIRGDIPVANPITWHQGRLIAGECRMGARILELPVDGAAPRVILDGIPMANAFQVGPDGKLYVPVMGANQIWRVDIDTGAHEVVAGDLGVPDSVKFDSKGRIVTTQVASGQVLRIDPVSGTREILADIGPGLDNVAFIGDRIFVSSIPGEITEIVEPGKVRSIVPRALQWPLGLAMGADGVLFVADGTFGYHLRPGGAPDLAGMIFYPGCPGYMRGVAPGAQAGEWVVTTGTGSVARYRPAEGASDFLSHGHDRLMGVAVAPGGAVIFAEYGTGRLLSAAGGSVDILADGLDGPMGVAVSDDGDVYVAEAGAGRIVRLKGGRTDIVLDGLNRPEGLALSGDRLFVVDTGDRCVIGYSLSGGARETLAENLPVGAPLGIKPKYLGPIGDMAGPMINFAGIAAGADGALYLSADAEGSVILLRPA
ncbi:SMP-30/gluconolactonase/LRE family protein [Sphingobium sp. BYY-5]|uniref:SMP-30/gluconolactonase/LRE family protein n=1 Tax=Sphingobium sp. BYY-5 TaxID=2926400 RepID=UPI001FA7F502|nr:SMP-30/gluconolactonase/LRE family protein [Sphingobium sp. BYY-5]MCI4592365.1 SMP-30/gluconolactonase/LRE family protein [Sphingobium sp. BYY-5]